MNDCEFEDLLGNFRVCIGAEELKTMGNSEKITNDDKMEFEKSVRDMSLQKRRKFHFQLKDTLNESLENYLGRI